MKDVRTTVICGHPLKFYLDPRARRHHVSDQPPHDQGQHLSGAAIEHARQRRRESRRLARTRGQVLAA